MNKKIIKLVSVLALLLPILLGLTGTVYAAESSQVTVNVHKRVFESGEKPSNILNTGEEMNFGGKALAEVTFEVYDVSTKYLELLQTMSPVEATNQITTEAEKATYAPNYATVVGTQKTDNEGIATFSGLDIKKNGKYATYLFVETNSPTDIKEKALPIVITMPLYTDGNKSNVINTNIHVYPKNEREKLIDKGLDETSKQALEVTINSDNLYNVEIGKEFGYSISALVPWNIADKDFYRITDTPNEGMIVMKDTIKIDGLTKGVDYIVYTDISTRGYVIYFNTESEAVKLLSGKRIEINYQAKLTEDVKIDTGINNKAFVEIGTITNPDDKPKWPTTPEPGYPSEPEKPTTENPDKPTNPTEPGTPENPVTGDEVFTGGKKFIKVDDKSGKTLAGAEFNLVKVDKDGNILEYANYSEGRYTWSQSNEGAKVYRSTEEGTFEIKGLEYSEKLAKDVSYAIKETKAPEGYALLDAPIKFNVTKDEFNTTELPITNIKKGLLPSTGGNGIFMFLVAGSILMVVALVWYRHTQVEAEV